MAITIPHLHSLKQRGEKFACLTAYDATFAHVLSSAGAEVLLVGDSLGMVLQGNPSTLPVSIEDMVYHTRGVARGNQGALVMADLPFMSYATPEAAMDNAAQLMRAGAHCIKLEGGAWLADTIHRLSERGIPVCAHSGLTPQFVNKLGGFKVQGRGDEAAAHLMREAKILEEAGADLLLLECVPAKLAAAITQQARIPVIGIGAGAATDAQVLVCYDLLGISTHRLPRFVKNFLDGQTSIQSAAAAYVADVKAGTFPGPEHAFES